MGFYDGRQGDIDFAESVKESLLRIADALEESNALKTELIRLELEKQKNEKES